MNFNSAVTQSNTWKRLKLQYVAAAAGAALALSAFVALSSGASDRAGSQPSSLSSLPGAVAASDEAPRAILYIFGSQAEATQFASILSQHTAAFAETNVQRYVQVAGSPEEKVSLRQLIGEAAREIMQQGSGRLDVVDLRPATAISS